MKSEPGLKFDGAEAMAPQKSSTKFAKNQFSGHSNDGRTVNMGRGPTRGNDGSCHHSGMAQSGKKPPVMAAESKKADPDGQRYGTQHRGGGREFTPAAGQNFKGNPDRINSGRGPTKGNQQ